MTRRRTDGCRAAISASGIHSPTAAKNASWKSASTLRFSQICRPAAPRTRLDDQASWLRNTERQCRAPGIQIADSTMRD